jgi:ribonuclease HI
VKCFAATDGACRGNPGASGVGVIVRNERGDIILSRSGYIGETTNNVAEYSALLLLLRSMQTIPCTRLVVQSDSELMVRQVNGQYKVKDPKLKRLFLEVQRLKANAPYTFELHYVPREQNTETDRLANEGIDAKTPIASDLIGVSAH